MRDITFLFIIIISLSLTSMAQTAAFTSDKLLPGDVEKFIKEYKGLVSDFELLGITYENKDHVFMFNEIDKYQTEIEGILKKHGYNDINSFLLKSTAIANAYASLQLKYEFEKNKAEIDKALKEIENNPSFTQEQKDQMKATIQMLQSGYQLSNPEDIELVKPFLKELDAIFVDTK